MPIRHVPPDELDSAVLALERSGSQIVQVTRVDDGWIIVHRPERPSPMETRR